MRSEPKILILIYLFLKAARAGNYHDLADVIRVKNESGGHELTVYTSPPN